MAFVSTFTASICPGISCPTSPRPALQRSEITVAGETPPRGGGREKTVPKNTKEQNAVEVTMKDNVNPPKRADVAGVNGQKWSVVCTSLTRIPLRDAVKEAERCVVVLQLQVCVNVLKVAAFVTTPWKEPI